MSKTRATTPKPSPTKATDQARALADDRHIYIIGRDAGGKIVAEDRTDSHQKAVQIAAGWQTSGLEVEITEQFAE